MPATKTNHLPTLSAADRTAALEKAKKARELRKKVKTDIEAGELDLRSLIDGKFTGFNADERVVIEKTKVLALVKSVRGIGNVRAKQILDEASIVETRTLRGLGKLQRESLKTLLSDR